MQDATIISSNFRQSDASPLREACESLQRFTAALLSRPDLQHSHVPADAVGELCEALSHILHSAGILLASDTSVAGTGIPASPTLTAGPTDTTGPESGKRSTQRLPPPRVRDTELSREVVDSLAAAMLLRDPGAKLTDIARQLRVSRGKLYRSPTFQMAWQMRQSQRGDIPQGWKDSDGSVEAIDSYSF